MPLKSPIGVSVRTVSSNCMVFKFFTVIHRKIVLLQKTGIMKERNS